jgi:hypothetical protein
MAGGKGSTFESDILRLIFTATPITGIADNAAITPYTNFYVTLHTADPLAGGDQTTNEATYAGYTRAAVTRTSGGWLVTGNIVTPVATITFPTSTSGGTETETFFGIGVAASGVGKLLYHGPITPSLVVTFGTIPQLGTATSITET